MKNFRWGFGLGFFLLISIILLFGLLMEEQRGFKKNYNNQTNIEENLNKDDKLNNPLDEVKLVDNKAIYDEDIDSHVDEMYVTVLPPKSYEAVTFKELYSNINYANDGHTSDNFDPVVNIVFEVGNPNKDNISYHMPNATMEIRGQSSRKAPQKSYKIKLFDDTEKWLGFKTINLNKHFSDKLRIRNKLSFDYFEILPDFVSLRTRFVKLYIKDLSCKIPDKQFEYYGLYTFIEQPNKSFLERHNLNPNGYLYKAEFFEFYRYSDIIQSKDEVTYDNNKFEALLEIRGNDNHEKFIEMLTAVNDYNRDINKVVDKYFDRDNMLTWMAVNILIDNHDTNSRNFLLYSPLNSSKWFFIPWDYDKAWIRTESRGRWQKSLANYWGMVLFNRFFKDKNNVEALSRKIEDLSNIINEKNTRRFLDSYYSIVKDNIFVPPDLNYLKITAHEYDKQYYSLSKLTEEKKKYYYESLENPMPFFLGTPKGKNGSYVFNWEPSYDLQGDDITYEFMLSTDYEFKNIVARYKKLKITSCKVENLKAGKYFWKVIVYDSKGNWQEAFDNCSVDTDDIGFGMKILVVQ